MGRFGGAVEIARRAFGHVPVWAVEISQSRLDEQGWAVEGCGKRGGGLEFPFVLGRGVVLYGPFVFASNWSRISCTSAKLNRKRKESVVSAHRR